MKQQPALLPHAAGTGRSQGMRIIQDHPEGERVSSSWKGVRPSQMTSHSLAALPRSLIVYLPPDSPENPYHKSNMETKLP